MKTLYKYLLLLLIICSTRNTYGYIDTAINQQLSNSFHLKLKTQILNKVDVRYCSGITSDHSRTLEVLYPISKIYSAPIDFSIEEYSNAVIDSSIIDEISSFLIKECKLYKSIIPLHNTAGIYYTCLESSIEYKTYNDDDSTNKVELFIHITVYFSIK